MFVKEKKPRYKKKKSAWKTERHYRQQYSPNQDQKNIKYYVTATIKRALWRAEPFDSRYSFILRDL